MRDPRPPARSRRRALLLALALAAPAASQAEEPQRIYLAPDDHTDFMWTLDEKAYEEAFVSMLDYYLGQIEATAGAPPEQQARWNCDGSYWLRVYERKKGPAAFARLMERVKDGHITAPLNTLALTFGAQPAEAVLRGMYYAGALERRFGARFSLALAMENATLPLGLASLWAGAGARYSWRGICNCASQVPDAGQRDAEIFRYSGLDGASVIMKWNSTLEGGSQHIGGYAEARQPATMVEYLGQNARFRARWPYALSAAFGKGWDDAATRTSEFVDVSRQLSTPQRQVLVSNQVDFFEEFARRYGDKLPEQRLAYGNEWDILSASMAELSAGVRRAVERLRGAEALATLVARQRPALWARLQGEREDAYEALGLYWEHDWTADGPVSRDARAAWQRKLAQRVSGYAAHLEAEAAAALSGMIAREGGAPRYYVFNPLGFARTDAADLPYEGAGPVHVVALDSGEEVPSQPVQAAGARRLRVLAEVPPVGYRVYEVRPGAGRAFPPAGSATLSGGAAVLSSDLLRAVVEGRGALSSLRLGQGKELVRPVGDRLVNDLGPGGGALTVEEAGPVTVTVLATAPASMSTLAHRTRVTLLRGAAELRIENEITQNFGDVRGWAFGFNVDAPDVWHEEVGAVLRARRVDQGGHYALRGARTDWLSLGHFADLSGGGVGVTLSSADLAFVKLGASTARLLDSATPQLTVLAGGQVDGPRLGIPAQGGDSRFLQRFALRPYQGSFDSAAAMRFALAHQNPLIAAEVRGGEGYPAARYSYLQVADPQVILWALKPAEDGVAEGGVVARLWNLGPAAAQAQVSTAERLGGARRATHLERLQQALPVTGGEVRVPLAAQQLGSLVLWGGGAPDPGPSPATPPEEAQPDAPEATGAQVFGGCQAGGAGRRPGFPPLGGALLLGALWLPLRRRRR